MSAPLDVPSLWLASLSQLDVVDAVVFADDRAACSLAWAIGLPALLDLGVKNVLRLGEQVAVAPAVPWLTQGAKLDHAIILCSTYLPEAYHTMRSSLCQVWPTAMRECARLCSQAIFGAISTGWLRLLTLHRGLHFL